MDGQKITFLHAIKHVLTHKSLTKLGYKIMLFRLVLSIMTPVFLFLKLIWKIIYQIIKPQSEVYKRQKPEIKQGDIGNPIYVKGIK